MNNFLRLFKYWILTSLNSINYSVCKLNIFLGNSQVWYVIKDRISFYEGVLVHQVDGLSCFVVVHSSEHFKSKIVNHFDAVDDFDVVSKLVVDNTRVLNDCGEVNIVLMTLLLIQPTMVIISA